MNKILMVLSAAFLYMLPAFGQTDNTYDNLLELYVDEKYENLCYKAEKYILSDKTKKDPLPYLYYSMGQFELNKDEDLQEKYPKAFKESLKFAVKFVKKDKKKEYIEDAEDYFADLRTAAMEDAENQLVSEKWTKAKGMYKYLVNLDAKDPGAKLYMSYATFKMRSVREAEIMLDDAITILGEIDLEELSPEQKSLLKNACVSLIEWEDNSNYREKLVTVLNSCKDYLSGDKEFDRAYDSFI